jgi:outer membrane lipoprotein
MIRITLVAAIAVALSACVTAPGPLRGEFPEVTPKAAGEGEELGEVVRWGGLIAKVEPLSDRTCFQVVGKRLASSGRPAQDDQTTGRFLACRAGFYDPKIFEEGREITIIGKIDRIEARTVGEYEYRHPRLAADVIYLWPVERNDDNPVRYNVGFGYYRWW